jgi:nucleoid-associated protein YgaU
MKDKIAELNKQSLPDPNKLKLHQVLQLPEPPTQTASR